MGQTASYSQQGLLPAHSPQQAVSRAVALPRGGPKDTGGEFTVGLGLGLVGGTAQPEIWTIDTTGSSGTFTLLFVADRVYSSGAVVYNVSTAALKTALELIFGEGSIATVTDTAGTQYVVTFAENVRYGGHPFFANTFGSGSISLTRTQRGCVGAGQYDVYDASTVTTIDALNQYALLLNPMGGRATLNSPGTDTPFCPPAFVEGFFNAADIPNIASGAVGNDKKLGYAIGASVSAAGTILRLSQKN